MLLYTARPSSMAATIEAKLSSVRIMSAASLATSVPATPIATPMSAFLSAGASFTPSPVTATISPISCRALTTRSFCSGAMRANTTWPDSLALSSSSPIFESSKPEMTDRSSPSTMPMRRAMLAAVRP